MNPPGLETTRYEVTADPPVFSGAVHETSEALSMEETAVTSCGALGGVGAGTTAAVVDHPDVPAWFEAVTLKVYETPFVKPFTVHDVAGSDCTEAAVVEQVREPGVEVTV